MKNFVLLYTGGTIPESEEEQAAVMGAWGAWYGGMGDKIVDGGNPFSRAMNVSADGVGEGSVQSPMATGYTVISAESLEAAVEAVRNHPHTQYGGQVTVHETFKM